MVINTRHTGLVVRDIDQSLKLYVDILGFKVWKRVVEEGSFMDQLVGIGQVAVETCKLKGPDDSMVELLKYISHPDKKDFSNSPSNQLGCSHIAFTVENIEDLYETLIDQGYHCKSKPLKSTDGNVKAMYGHDMDGIILEFVEELN